MAARVKVGGLMNQKGRKQLQQLEDEHAGGPSLKGQDASVRAKQSAAERRAAERRKRNAARGPGEAKELDPS